MRNLSLFIYHDFLLSDVFTEKVKQVIPVKKKASSSSSDDSSEDEKPAAAPAQKPKPLTNQTPAKPAAKVSKKESSSDDSSDDSEPQKKNVQPTLKQPPPAKQKATPATKPQGKLLICNVSQIGTFIIIIIFF